MSLATTLVFNFSSNFAFAIEENQPQNQNQKQNQAQNQKNTATKKKTSFFDIIKFKKDNNDQKENNSKGNSKKFLKAKKKRVEDIKLPKVTSGPPKDIEKLGIMTIEDCVEYAISHNPNLMKAKSTALAIKTGVNQARSNYAPKLTGRVNYNHNSTQARHKGYDSDNGIGFNVGISQMIWDFGRTTAKINMGKYNYEAAMYDYDYEILNVVYDVKINYYKVLRALASLDVYEQNMRIQTLNFERTKAMFDEGLKSKIDVVNAQVNLTDSKIQMVEGQNVLETAIVALKNSMYYQDDDDFIVKNTENFGFLKVDYRKKVESFTTIKQNGEFKRTPEGLIMLTSGIEHKDIIQNFEFKPLTLSKQKAVSDALELRPDLKSSMMLARVQEESLKAIKKQYMPEITGDLTWGYTRSENNYTSPLQLGASVGVGSINPMNIHYQVVEGENYLDVAYDNVNIAKTDIFWEVQTNYINMRQLERKIPLMNSKVKATLENFELADGRYSVGLNNYVELQDALARYNTSQLNFVDAVFEYNVARETLLKSMGVR